MILNNDFWCSKSPFTYNGEFLSVILGSAVIDPTTTATIGNSTVTGFTNLKTDSVNGGCTNYKFVTASLSSLLPTTNNPFADRQTFTTSKKQVWIGFYNKADGGTISLSGGVLKSFVNLDPSLNFLDGLKIYNQPFATKLGDFYGYAYRVNFADSNQSFKM